MLQQLGIYELVAKTRGAMSMVSLRSAIGGQGTYGVQFQVKDANTQAATTTLSFAVAGSNAFMASLFPPGSIFHHRVDAATTGLPVDTSPAAAIYSLHSAVSARKSPDLRAS
jgi:hypothetical protein